MGNCKFHTVSVIVVTVVLFELSDAGFEDI